METSQNSNIIVVYAIMWLGYFLAAIKFMILAWAINDALRSVSAMLLSFVFLILSHLAITHGFRAEKRRAERVEAIEHMENSNYKPREMKMSYDGFGISKMLAREGKTEEVLDIGMKLIKELINSQSQGKKKNGRGRPKKNKKAS